MKLADLTPKERLAELKKQLKRDDDNIAHAYAWRRNTEALIVEAEKAIEAQS